MRKMADVKGKIVLCDIWFLPSHPTDLWSWNKDAEVYDPEGKIDRDAIFRELVKK